MEQKETRNIILIVVVVLVVIIAGYFVLNGQMGQNNISKIGSSQAALQGKKVSDLMKLNTPIECDLIGALENARANRKKGEGVQVATKLFIKGFAIREEGVSIFTDGSEKNTVNIINSQDRTLFSLLLNGSGKMASLDYNQAGGDATIMRYNNIAPTSMACKASSFSANLLVPQNVCYLPPSKSTPACY